MKKPAPADLQRWSEEVARDPASLAFLPLARAYRRQGLRDAARQLCVRGLEHYPNHAEAHSLLALLYLESGDRARAADEWSMVLRMDPDHFEALRGIGFCYLEQDQLSRARQALERAALLRPMDAMVQEALLLLGTRQELHSGGANIAASPDDVLPDQPVSDDVPDATQDTAATATAETDASGFEPWAESPAPSATSPQLSQPSPQYAHASPSQQPARPAVSADPSRIFDALTSAGPLFGILLLDAQGLVLAGELNDAGVDDPSTAGSSAYGVDTGSAELLGATLGPAITEAGRTVSLLSLGTWRGMLIEAGAAVLYVSPATDNAAVLLAARRNAPTGWVLRTAAQAADIAARYLEEYA
jgi:hypothetical protein